MCCHPANEYRRERLEFIRLRPVQILFQCPERSDAHDPSNNQLHKAVHIPVTTVYPCP